jgi:uncharacterized protein YprB with RNaseH-like and TPR domain
MWLRQPRKPLQHWTRYLYLDIETNPWTRRIWLIGIFDPRTGQFTQFFSRKWSQERRTIRMAFKFLRTQEGRPLCIYSGSYFDLTLLRERALALGLGWQLNRFRRRDLGRFVMDYLAVPFTRPPPDLKGLVPGPYSLKTLETILGVKRKSNVSGGEHASRLYDNYIRLKRKSIRMQLLRYNKEDLTSLATLAKFLNNLGPLRRRQVP